ncbi:hypothetical protein SprV_0100232900 [Sparganum proliferum]
MDLFGHMRIHENEFDRSPATASIFSTPTMPSAAHNPPPSATTVTSSTTSTTGVDTDTADCSWPYYTRTFTLRIGLVGRLRIRRIKTGEPMPVAPTYNRRIHQYCPLCTRASVYRMGLLGHMRAHEDLRSNCFAILSISSIITGILLSIPRRDSTQTQNIIYDYNFFTRIVLVVFYTTSLTAISFVYLIMFANKQIIQQS